MRRFVLLCLLVIGLSESGFATTPEMILEQYATHILNEEFSQIPRLFAAESRESIKKVMDKALKAEIKKGRFRLQDTMAGRRIKKSEVKAISAETYLEKLLSNYLSSTEAQGFLFEKYKLLGRVDETDELAHLLIRTYVKARNSGFDNVQVYSFRRDKEGWGLLTPQALKQVLLVIEASSQR